MNNNTNKQKNMEKKVYTNIESIYKIDTKTNTVLPLFLESVSAGFPSPADDYIENKLDLNEYLIKNPSSTFFVRVTGDSMINAGVFSGDILIVDRSLIPKSGNIIIAILDGELTVKRLIIKGKQVILAPENTNYKEIIISGNTQFNVWGVVRSVIHNLL